MLKYFRVLLGLLLWPCCFAAARAVYAMLAAGTGAGGEMFWLGTGIGLVLWIAVFAFLPAPVKSYVLAHELTHALWGHLFGAAILGMRVSRNGGSVRLTESNAFVALAPYFFPFYAVLVVCFHALLSIFFDLDKYHLAFLAAVGFTLGFHLFFTVSVLATRQSDIDLYGKIFSYSLICFMNLLAIGLLIVAILPVSIMQFAGVLGAELLQAWMVLRGWALYLCGRAAASAAALRS